MTPSSEWPFASVPKERIEIGTKFFLVEPFTKLTRREKEIVFIFVTRGSSRKQAADLFDVCKQTIDIHLTTIYRKVGVDHSCDPLWQLTIKCLKAGVVKLEECSWRKEKKKLV